VCTHDEKVTETDNENIDVKVNDAVNEPNNQPFSKETDGILNDDAAHMAISKDVAEETH